MPAIIPVDNTLGALFIGAILSSIVYGITLLQVYSYYNNHASRDRWPLKSFVAFLALVDTVNVVFVTHSTYYLDVTNFGDYSAFLHLPWSLPSIALCAVILEVSVQHFYAYRIYLLSGRSPYISAAISASSLTAFGLGIALGVKGLQRVPVQNTSFQNIFIASISCDLVCDFLITCGMVYTLLRNRTRVRRTNDVLNLLAIYAINCGILNLIFSISGIILVVRDRDSLIYTVPSYIMIRLYFCAFMSILNTRDYLRETLDGSGLVMSTFTQRSPSSNAGNAVRCGVQVTTETSNTLAGSKTLPPVQFSSDTSYSESESVALDREKYPVSPVPAYEVDV